MAQQTAVEILVENLKMILPISQFNDVLVQDVIKQANEIMEQQIKQAWLDGTYNTNSKGYPSETYSFSEEEYYNEKYNKQ